MKKYFNKYNSVADYETASPKWPEVSYIEETEEVKYETKHIDYSTKYFTTVALSNGNITFSGSSLNKLSYSKDEGSTWTQMASQTVSVPVNEGDKVMWKGKATPQYSDGIGTFTTAATANFNVEGNAMSLLYGDDFVGQTSLSGKNYAFAKLFQSSKKVVSAENLSLPATTLATFCYNAMFYNCSSLTTAPELPATTLAYGCYNAMLEDCTNLTTAPELLATTLTAECYRYMLYGCTSLNSITCLATDISATECTKNWVKNVGNSGTFTKSASMTSWTTGTAGIPQGWTVVDA